MNALQTYTCIYMNLNGTCTSYGLVSLKYCIEDEKYSTATNAWPSWNSITVWVSVCSGPPFPPPSPPSPQTRVILTLTFLFLKLLLSHPFSLSPSSHTKKAPSLLTHLPLLANESYFFKPCTSHTRLFLYDFWKQMCIVGDVRCFMSGATYSTTLSLMSPLNTITSHSIVTHYTITNTWHDQTNLCVTLLNFIFHNHQIT